MVSSTIIKDIYTLELAVICMNLNITIFIQKFFNKDDKMLQQTNEGLDDYIVLFHPDNNTVNLRYLFINSFCLNS